MRNTMFPRRLAGAFVAACGLLLAATAAHADLVYHCTSTTVTATYTEGSNGRDIVYAYPSGPTVDYPDSAITPLATTLGKELTVKDASGASRSLTLVVADVLLTDNKPHSLSGWYFTIDPHKTGILEVDKGTKLTCTVMQTGFGQSFALGGTVKSDSAWAGLTLFNNGTDPLAITGTGAFTFPNAYPYGSSYDVTASPIPNGICHVDSGTGTLTSNVNSVLVDCVCTPGFSVCGGGSCTNTSVDTGNCGACGVKCGPNQACVNGACTGNSRTKQAFLGQH